MDNLFEINMALRCEVKALRQTIKEYESGKRYLKIQKDHSRVVAGYIKEIKKLKAELASAHDQIVYIRNLWTDQSYDQWKEHTKEIGEKDKEILRLKDKIWDMERKKDEKITSITLEYEEQLHEKNCIIDELKNKLAHAESLLGRDGTNTGLPTSKTPPGKEKRIPNSRTKSSKPKGGQPGHEKHKLEEPDGSEVTDIIEHGGEGLSCPDCEGKDYTPAGESEEKYEYDVQVIVKKTRHIFYYYKCNDCGTEFRSVIPPELKEKAQYGSGIQALALSLMNTVNASMNKVAMFLSGITNGELTPCDGYICKLQGRAAKSLQQFRSDLKMLLITRVIVYWDDTVIPILTKRACLRFYGDETIAYYTAHEHKNMESIDDDNVLPLLTSDTKVMHDHNTVNYNKKFRFENIECNQHVQRDCQRNSDNTCHQWSAKLKRHIGITIKDRNKAIARGKTSFDSDYIKRFYRKVDECLAEGWKENENDPGNYGADFERALLRRIEKFRTNYFSWVEDFSLPTTNNLSERALRCVKSHMKISGQFESVSAADNYALIKTYIETCRRNSINEIDALERLCEGNPYTVQEIFTEAPS